MCRNVGAAGAGTVILGLVVGKPVGTLCIYPSSLAEALMGGSAGRTTRLRAHDREFLVFGRRNAGLTQHTVRDLRGPAMSELVVGKVAKQ